MPHNYASCKDTITTYANQLQLLTLANAELREENNQLQRQAAQHTNLRVLDQGVPRTGGGESGGALRVSGLRHE